MHRLRQHFAVTHLGRQDFADVLLQSALYVPANANIYAIQIFHPA
jgi:hypothetical protein